MRVKICLAILLSIVGDFGSATRAQPLRTPDGRPAAVLERIDSVEGLMAIAVRPDGLEAIGAFAIAGREDHTALRRYGAAAAEPEETVVSGQVRDCVYSPDGLTVYGIVHRPARKRTGDTYLFVLDPATLKFRSANRLPTTSRDLDLWHERASLLIAASDEVRTIALDGLRSGPLFRITGNNRAVASRGGTATILVGQDDSLVLVDLDAPPGPTAMPEMERLKLSQPVSGLALAPDGRAGLARMADGSLLAIGFDPLRVDPSGSGIAVGVGTPAPRPPVAAATVPPLTTPQAPAPPTTVSPPSSAASSTPAPQAAAAEVSPPSATPPSAPVQPGPEATNAAPPSSAPPSTSVPPQVAAAPSPAPTTSSSSTPVQPPAPLPPPEALAPGSAPRTFDAPGPDARAWGRLTGAEAANVREVVLFGPDSVLREAGRVTPHGGIWEASGLAPGRYRVQLDAGGDRVLVSRPGFLLIDVPPTGTVQAGDCEVVGVIQAEGRR